jgi:endonuclease/exonuclease/phosphatase family metal-dependent hydrolase
MYLVAAICVGVLPIAAHAQTTVVLDAPDSEVVDTTIRGGSYAAKVLEKEPLTTRASDNLEYERRVLLKFDTERPIAARASIQSATLTVTVKYANPTTRTISAYRVGSSWDEAQATWNSRKSGMAWGTSGGDLAAVYARASAGYAAGSKVTFDVTRLVQEAVNGNFGSRYTRIALVDDGTATNDSYHEYYGSESTDVSVRPKLTVVVGSTTTTTTTTTTSTTTTGTLKLLHWNTHHGGVGTDGRYDPVRLAGWIAKINPHIASLNEVDTDAQVNAIISALQTKTGVTWRKMFSGRGNLVITKLALNTTSKCVYPDGVRYAAHLGVTVNGRPINVWSTHLTVDSAAARLAETKAMQGCADDWPQARIIAGDYNMQVGTTEYNQAVVGYTDAWKVAKAAGTAINYSGNCDGCTRNSRIDYVFTSTGATFLAIKSAQMVDTRDSSGYMPSDHKPLVVTYAVK